MGNIYSMSEFLKNVYSLAMTKITMRQARFVRRPVYIRGKASLSGCENLTMGRFCRFDLPGYKKTLFIGKNCEMGDMTHIVAHNKVKIGNDVLMASKCFISDTNHGNYSGDIQDGPKTIPNNRKLHYGSITIGDNVWIGENAVVLSGADIGDGCIIGANSVVSKVIPKECIVVGVNSIIKKWDKSQNSWTKIIE